MSTEEEVNKLEKEYSKKERDDLDRRILRIEKANTSHYYVNKENIFSFPYNKYKKYKTKSEMYRRLYLTNRISFYTSTSILLFWKFFHKKLMKKVLSICIFSFVLYLFEQTGAKHYMFKSLSSLYKRIKKKISG